ncbi:hypothetical protein SDC9_140892 [bioreactor metagenome]|uniref:Uncharacterized protein n=1 Tax=bioreactor metagenome TaxID=1076179 RepID=A0A645DW65_9ZZZZ
MAQPGAEADAVEQRLGPVARFAPGDAAEHRRQHCIFNNVEFRQQLVILENKTDLAVAEPRRQLAGSHLAVIDAVVKQRPGVGSLQRADQIEQSGLARTRRAEEHRPAAAAEIIGDVVEHFDPAGTERIILADLFQTDQNVAGFGHHSYLSARAGSSRAARRAGIIPPAVQSTIADTTITSTSPGTICAGNSLK